MKRGMMARFDVIYDLSYYLSIEVQSSYLTTLDKCEIVERRELGDPVVVWVLVERFPQFFQVWYLHLRFQNDAPGVDGDDRGLIRYFSRPRV